MRRAGLNYLILFICSFCALVFLCDPAMSQVQPPDYSNIRLTLEQGKFQDVLNLVSRLSQAGTDPVLTYYKAIALAGLEKRSAAIKELTKAISLDPTKSQFYLRRGLIFFENGKTSEAIADFTAALELTPTMASAFGRRAHTFLATGQTSKALDDANSAVRQAPTNADFYKLRADILSTVGDYENALQDYNKAIGLAPYLVTAINNRAIALANLNRPKEAVEDLNSAMELSTSRPSSSGPSVFQGSQW